jgi:predicted nucleotidyltransferase
MSHNGLRICVLDVFGSHARGCETEKNDLDILIDLPPKNRKNYFDYFF